MTRRFLSAAAVLLLFLLPAVAQTAPQHPQFQRPQFQRPQFQRPGTAAAAPAAEPDAGLVELFGDSLLTDKGHKAELSELNGKIIAVYFSASWCPPCRAFSPLLVKLSDRLRAEGKPFALVLVGRDQDKKKAVAYMKDHDMEGYLVPPEAKENRALCERYGVSGIPTLVIVDSSAKTIDRNARGTVQSTPDTAWDKWTN
jgi:nucleoredoxin